MLWLIKIKAEVYYCLLVCIDLVCILWRSADSNECRFGYHCRRRAIDCCHRERGSKLISPLVYWFWRRPQPTPFAEAPGGGVCLSNKTMPLERQTTPSWWWCLWAVCFRCFTSKKPSEWEIFVPAKTDLAVKLLKIISACSAGSSPINRTWRRGAQGFMCTLGGHFCWRRLW